LSSPTRGRDGLKIESDSRPRRLRSRLPVLGPHTKAAFRPYKPCRTPLGSSSKP
jgi:hypothetical protein